MRYLFDTHAFLWWDMQSSRLSPTVLAVCQDPANELILSLVSVWEIQIKQQLGKLRLAAPLEAIVNNQQSINGIELLSIELPHILGLAELPDHHRDPFDRLLISQATAEQLTLITSDPQIARYSVEVVW